MLYYLNDNDKQQLKTAKRTNLQNIGWLEKDLELLLEKNMDRLLDEQHLMPIFTQRSFQEEPDIMALDRTGKLFIFELKRWKSNSENLLQVFRYGQIFGQNTYDQLNSMYLNFNKGAKSLLEEHRTYFDLKPEECIKKEHFNQQQHFLVVTDGTDLKTREAINYWKESNLNIDSIVYRVYQTTSGENLIEFNSYSPFQDVIEYEETSFILNTNYKNNPNSHKAMLDQEKASAFFAPWKLKINNIQKGDRVFLYKSGTGIVATGIGTGELKSATYEGKEDEEFYTPLDNFKILKTPLKAAKIKEAANSNFVFNQTMFRINKTKGDLILGYMEEYCF